MTTDLFTSSTEDTQIDPTKTYYQDLVGDDKKFKTNEDLARSKIASDNFIEQLKTENAGIRQELSTRQTLEQLMDKLATSSKPEDHSNQNNQNDSNDNSAPKSLSEDELTKLIEAKLEGRDKVRVQNENLSLVRNTLISKFGNDYVSKLKNIASNLGVEESFLQEVAKNQPKVFLNLVGINSTTTKSNNQLFTLPTGNKPEHDFNPTGDRLESYYNNLKQKNSSEYWSPKVQNQMHNDAIRLGEKFFDT